MHFYSVLLVRCISCFSLPEIEMVFNGIISLLLVVPAQDAESVVTLFCEKVGKLPDGDKRAGLRLRMYVL